MTRAAQWWRGWQETGNYIIAPTSLRRRYTSPSTLRGSIVLHIHFKGLLIPEFKNSQCIIGLQQVEWWLIVVTLYVDAVGIAASQSCLYLDGPCRDGVVYAPTKACAIKTEVWSTFSGTWWKVKLQFISRGSLLYQKWLKTRTVQRVVFCMQIRFFAIDYVHYSMPRTCL